MALDVGLLMEVVLDWGLLSDLVGVFGGRCTWILDFSGEIFLEREAGLEVDGFLDWGLERVGD